MQYIKSKPVEHVSRPPKGEPRGLCRGDGNRGRVPTLCWTAASTSRKSQRQRLMKQPSGNFAFSDCMVSRTLVGLSRKSLWLGQRLLSAGQANQGAVWGGALCDHNQPPLNVLYKCWVCKSAKAPEERRGSGSLSRTSKITCLHIYLRVVLDACRHVVLDVLNKDPKTLRILDLLDYLPARSSGSPR